jgi:hypothetical protein
MTKLSKLEYPVYVTMTKIFNTGTSCQCNYDKKHAILEYPVNVTMNKTFNTGISC